MTPVRPFDADGWTLLERALAQDWLIALDYDGTLAPLVDRPADALIPAPAFVDLARLARHRTVAVISGRSRADVGPRLPPEIGLVIGNHGCEGPDDDPRELDQAQRVAAGWLDQVMAPATAAGLRVESKGPSLALHWRGIGRGSTAAGMPGTSTLANVRVAAMEAEAEAQAIRLALALHPRPHLIQGDRVLNLLPPGLPDKGAALLHLLDRTGRPGAVFIGDDITDAAVFRLRDPGILGIEVGIKGLGADWSLPDVAAVHALIQRMTNLLPKDDHA